MKRIFVSLIAGLALLVAQAARADLTVTELIGFGAGGMGPPTLTYITTSTSTANASSYTSASLSITTPPSPDRWLVYVPSHGVTGVDRSFTGVTANVDSGGANAMTELVESDTSSGLGRTSVAVYVIAAPTGSNVVFAASLSGASDRFAGHFYTLTGVSNPLSAFHTNQNSISGTFASIGTTLNIPAGGAAVSACTNRANSITFTWTGLTEDVDAIVESAMSYSAAHSNAMSAETGRTLTCTFSSSVNSADAMAAVSWGP